jgi:hypothetical protein
MYKKGIENHVVDALSRRIDVSGEFCFISAPVPQWLQSVQDSHVGDVVA